MKRLLFIIVLALIALGSSAQNADTLALMRVKDTYYVDSVKMNKRAFMGYLQSQGALTYKKFRAAYRLSNVGWGLFGGGILLIGIAYPLGYGLAELVSIPVDERFVFFSLLAGTYEFRRDLYILGGAVTASGIICLGVGYGRMHKAADNYIAKRRKTTAVTLTLNSSSDGVGFALRF